MCPKKQWVPSDLENKINIQHLHLEKQGATVPLRFAPCFYWLMARDGNTSSQHDITNALVVAVRLLGSALTGHAAFLHHTAGMGVVGVVFGGDAVKIAGFKQVAEDPLQRLRHDALMPPGLANAIGHFYTGELVVEIHAADAPDGLSHLFGHNEPLIEVVLPVATHPTLQDLSGGLWAGMDRPGEILDNLRVGGPVVKHGLGVLYGSSAENEPLGFNGLGSLVDWHRDVPALPRLSAACWWGCVWTMPLRS